MGNTNCILGRYLIGKRHPSLCRSQLDVTVWFADSHPRGMPRQRCSALNFFVLLSTLSQRSDLTLKSSPFFFVRVCLYHIQGQAVSQGCALSRNNQQHCTVGHLPGSRFNLSLIMSPGSVLQKKKKLRVVGQIFNEIHRNFYCCAISNYKSVDFAAQNTHVV